MKTVRLDSTGIRDSGWEGVDSGEKVSVEVCKGCVAHDGWADAVVIPAEVSLASNHVKRQKENAQVARRKDVKKKKYSDFPTLS